MDEEDTARWWAEVRRFWGFTPASDAQERCDRCGRIVKSVTVDLLAHRDWHEAKERHPSAR